jgi:hypothetical protein
MTAVRINPLPIYPASEKNSPHQKKATTAATTGSSVAAMAARPASRCFSRRSSNGRPHRWKTPPARPGPTRRVQDLGAKENPGQEAGRTHGEDIEKNRGGRIFRAKVFAENVVKRIAEPGHQTEENSPATWPEAPPMAPPEPQGNQRHPHQGCCQGHDFMRVIFSLKKKPAIKATQAGAVYSRTDARAAPPFEPPTGRIRKKGRRRSN